jgi:hypothetical protein
LPFARRAPTTGGPQLTTDDVFVELAPRGVATLRTVHTPGDESASRRRSPTA